MTDQNKPLVQMPANQASNQPNGLSNQASDISMLKQIADQELAARTPVKNSQNVNSVLRENEDPLAKLISLVKGNDGVVKEEKIAQLFVITKKKVANDMLQELVHQMRMTDVDEKDIVQVILNLDKLAEDGELENSFFTNIDNN